MSHYYVHLFLSHWIRRLDVMLHYIKMYPTNKLHHRTTKYDSFIMLTTLKYSSLKPVIQNFCKAYAPSISFRPRINGNKSVPITIYVKSEQLMSQYK